ncbi:MAG: ThuA domain-containing protein [Armatimonadetes bacterium]|nr:ThuA domain-containing protein [Armatimonadota bacterium]
MAQTGQKVLYFTRHTVYTIGALPSPLKPLDAPSLSDNVVTEIGKRAGLEVVCTNNGEVFDGDLSQYGTFVFFSSGSLQQLMGPESTQGSPPISARGKDRLFAALAAGTGFVGIRNTVSCSEELIGCHYNGHVRTQAATMLVKSPGFPGLSGAGECFSIVDPWYTFRDFQSDIHVVLAYETAGAEDVEIPEPRWQEIQKKLFRPPFPSTWARMHGKSRVFYTSMGNYDDTWNSPIFQAMLQGAITWTIGRVDADVAPNLSAATPGANQLSR